MKTINIMFDDNDFLEIKKIKGSRSWRKFILQMTVRIQDYEKLEHANQVLQDKIIELSNELRK